MTISEIAEKANVSIGTVDRVIHNRGRVSPETKERITKIIEESGFKPDSIARHLKLHKKFLVGILLPLLESESGYWKLQFEGIKKAVAELSSFSIIPVLGEFDRNIEGDCFEAGCKLLQSNVDALIIAPVRPLDVFKLLPKLSKTPYVFVDSTLPDANPIFSAAQNPFNAGYCAGRMMNLLCPNAKKLLTVQFHSVAHNLRERARGFYAYFVEKKIDIEINNILRTDSKQDSSSFFDSIFEKYSNLDGIFFTNDAAYQLDEYIISKKMKKDFILIGYDLLDQNINGLKSGGIDCIISQRPEQQGYDAVSTLYRSCLMQQEIENMLAIPIDIYLKENVYFKNGNEK